MSPFDWLFPTWSDPLALTLLVGLRVLLNGSLTLLVAKTVGSKATATLAMTAGTAVSAVLTVLVLRPGLLGINASYVEFVLQLGLLVVAGYTVFSQPTDRRTTVAAAVGIAAATLLALVMIPLYGEALVAP